MDKLGAILESYAAKGERPGGDGLLGAAFVVVNRDGESKQEGERTRFTSMGGRASSLIMHDSGVVYRGAARRNRAAAGSPEFTPESFCWVASMTKVVAATCSMQLVE